MYTEFFVTDYPFTGLGDKSGKPAPIRWCKIVSYDGDKYVNIRVYDTTMKKVLLGAEIKKGYVYRLVPCTPF